LRQGLGGGLAHHVAVRRHREGFLEERDDQWVTGLAQRSHGLGLDEVTAVFRKQVLEEAGQAAVSEVAQASDGGGSDG